MGLAGVSHEHSKTPDAAEGPYRNPTQPSKEVGPQVTNDNVEGNTGPHHQADHAAKKEGAVLMTFHRGPWPHHGQSRAPRLRPRLGLCSWSGRDPDARSPRTTAGT